MSNLAVKAKRRDPGKSTARALRRDGMIPGVYYLVGKESMAIAVNSLDMRPVVYTAERHIIELEVEGSGEKRECILKDVVFDPITDKIVHFDFQGLDADKEVSIEVPVIVRGTAKGEISGGVVQQVMHKLSVICLPKNLPETIDVNVEELNIGQNIRVRELDIPNVTIVENEDTVVVAVTVPRVAKTEGIDEGTEEQAEQGEAESEES